MADPWATPPSALGRLESRLRRARSLIDELCEEAPERLDYVQERIHVYAKLGAVLQRLERQSEAAEAYQHAIELATSLVTRSPSARRPRLDRALCREALALLELQLGRTEQARLSLNEAVTDLRSLAKLGGDSTVFAPPPESFETLAEQFQALGETDRAEELRHLAAEVRSRHRAFPPHHGRPPQPGDPIRGARP